MPYPSNVDMTNQCLTQQAFKAERDRIDDERSDRINKKYFDSLSSSRASSSSRKSSPISNNPDLRALDKKLAERWEQYDRRHFPNMHNASSSNTSSSSSKSTNLFSSWFGKK